MNKFITKLAKLFLGISMAAGVGVAVSVGKKQVTKSVEAGDSYEKLTAAPSDWSGEYLLAYDVSATSAKLWTGVDSSDSYVSATVSSNKITTVPSGAVTLTVATMTGGYSVKVNGGTNNGKYIYGTSGSNKTNFGTSASLNTFSYSSGVLMTSNTSVMRFNNGTSNGQWFRYYKSTTYTSQQVVQLYKKAITTHTVTVSVNNSSYGTVTQSSVTNVADNASISASGNTLTVGSTNITASPKSSTAQYNFAFSNWSGIPTDGKVTGNITVTANFSATTRTYDVTNSVSNSTFTGASTVAYGTAYSGTFSAKSGYVLPASLTSVTIAGSASNNYSYNSSTGAFSIAAQYVTGAIVINGACDETGGDPVGISYSLSHCTLDSTPTQMYPAQELVLTISPDSHYKLPAEDANKVSVTGAVDWVYDEETGSIMILGASSAVTVSAECIAKAQNTISMGTLTGVSQANGNPTSVEEGETVTLTFTANEGYGLPTSSGVTVSGTGASSTWTQGTGKLQITGGTGNITVSINGIARTLTSITLSSNSGSYTLGDAFVMPTVTAVYNIGGNENVTSQATATGGGLESGVLTSTGTKTITISYGGQSATYTATVTAIVPSAGGIAKVTSTSDLTVGSTVYLVCEGQSKQLSGISTTSTKYGLGADYTTTPANTYPLTVCAGNGGTGYAFKNSSNNYLYWTTGNSLNQNSTLSDNTSWTVSFDDDGNATILNVHDNSREIMWNYSSPRFACYSGQTPTYDTAQGYNMVQIYKNYPAVVKSLKWITAEVKSGTYYQGSDVTASDFTVTAHYDDGTTSTPTSDITVTNATLTVIGSNTVTLTYGGKSCNVTVTAVEQTAVYTGLAWSQAEYTIIDGQGIDFSKFGTVTAEYDNGDSHATKSIAVCSVATYTKSGDVYTKVTDLDDGDKIDSSSDGKYLGVTYTETNTYTAYSSAPIFVVEAINDVYEQVATYSWSKVTSLSAGDVVTFVSEEHTKVASEMGNNIISAVSYEGSVSTDFYFTVGTATVENKTYYTFQNENGYLGNHSTGTSGNNNAYLDAKIDTETNKNYFTVSFDEGNAVITSVYDGDRVLQMRSGATNDRFCFYGSSQDVIQLYKRTAGYSPSGESFANTNATVQKAVLQFAEHFNDTMQCVNGGSTADVSSKWATLSGDFTTELSKFTGDNLDHFKALFANAYSIEGGDTLQDMLARYDYIVAKYKLSDFLNSATDRPEVAQSTNVSPLLNIVGDNTNTIAIIVIISLVSVGAIGGYFFLRKRKETNL